MSLFKLRVTEPCGEPQVHKTPALSVTRTSLLCRGQLFPEGRNRCPLNIGYPRHWKLRRPTERKENVPGALGAALCLPADRTVLEEAACPHRHPRETSREAEQRPFHGESMLFLPELSRSPCQVGGGGETRFEKFSVEREQRPALGKSKLPLAAKASSITNAGSQHRVKKLFF